MGKTDSQAIGVRVPATNRRTVLLAGASGLVGQEILHLLLADSTCTAVHTVGRRVMELSSPKLTQHLSDLRALPALPQLTEAYIALGTTIRVAGSQAAFRAVDFDAFVAVARAARSSGATKLGVVSAMGADARSAVFYSRVKGEMEQALQTLGFDVLVFARPALITGDRAALAQPQRMGESLGLRAMRFLKPVTPKNYQPVTAANVGAALLTAVQTMPHGVHVVLSGKMQAN